MKTILLIAILSFCFNFFIMSQTGTDTIYRSISTQQGDSLIQANTGNPDFVIMDMRTPSEYSGGHIQNAVNMNYYSPTLSAELDALDKNKIYLLYCAAGSRSTATFNLMKSKHFRELYNMLGGISQWISLGYPVVTGTTGITKIQETDGFQVYPNPCSDFLYVNVDSDVYGQMRLYNFVGNEVLISINKISENKYQLNLKEIAKGVYFLNIGSENKTYTKRITVF